MRLRNTIFVILVCTTNLFAEQKAIVTVPSPALLKEPKYNFDGSNIVTQMYRCDTVEILEQTKEKDKVCGKEDYWYKVKDKSGKEGWLYGGFLEIIQPNGSSNSSFTNIIRLTDGKNDKGYIAPTFSNDGENIVFASSRSKTYHIWIMDKNGGNLREISKLSWDMEPIWSPDNKYIVFASYGPNRNKGVFNIWTIGVDGTKLSQLTFDEDYNDDNQYPKWSPDGRSIVWSHAKQVWIMDRDGLNKKLLTSQPAKAYERPICWSSDSKFILYSGADTSYGRNPYKPFIIQRDGKNQRRILENIPSDEYMPPVNVIKYSKDGKFLYLHKEKSILKMDFNEQKVVKEILLPVDEVISIDISPDEKCAVFDDSGCEVAGNIYKYNFK